MHIGIAGPVTINLLMKHVSSSEDVKFKGLGGTSITRLIKELWNRGHKISVFTLDSEVKPGILETIIGARIKIYVGHLRKKHRIYDFFLEERKQLKHAMLIDDVPFVNAHWTYEYAMSAIESGKPHLITPRDNPIAILKFIPRIYRLGRLFMAWWVFRNGQHFSTTSPYMQNVLKFWGVHEAPIIPNTLDNRWFTTNAIEVSHRNPRIIAINNGWSRRKNMKRALRAFNFIRQHYPCIHFDLFGHEYGPGEKAHQWAMKNSLDKRVHFKGFHSSDLLREILPHYQMLVHPALEESFGNTFIEAMTQRVPVLGGKKSGAVPWVLDHGKAGILVDVTRAREISKGVDIILSNEDYAEDLTERAYAYAISNFSPNKVILEYEDLYKKLL